MSIKPTTMNVASPKSIKQKLWVAVRFVIFGCVGFYFLLFGSVILIARVMGYAKEFMSPLLSLPLAGVGALMMLYGVGEWRRWAYLLVFLSIPFSLILLLLLTPDGSTDKMSPVIGAAVAAFTTYAGVRAYYARRPREDS